MAKKSPYIKVTRKEYIENRRLLDYNDSELYYTFENIKINNLEEFLEYCKTKIYPQLLLAKEEHISDIKDDFEVHEDYMNEYDCETTNLETLKNHILKIKNETSIDA